MGIKSVANDHGTTEIDRHLGVGMRMARRRSGNSVVAAAKMLGLSPFILQRVEAGTEPVSSETLLQASMLYEYPISDFFDGFVGSDPSKRISDLAELKATCRELIEQISDAGELLAVIRKLEGRSP